MADGKEKNIFIWSAAKKLKDVKEEMQREDLCEFLLFGTA